MLNHLTRDGLYEFVEGLCPAVREYRRPLENIMQTLEGYLAVFDRNRGNLVGKDVGGVPDESQILAFVRKSAPYDNDGLQKIVKTGCKNPPHRDRIEFVTGTAYPLKKSRHLTRRAELNHLTDMPYIETEFHRGRAYEGF